MKKNPPDNHLSQIKIPVSQLTLGMYVTELDRSWLVSPFVFHGFFLSIDEHIAIVQAHCEFVIVDRSRIFEIEIKSLQQEQLRQLVYPVMPSKNSSFFTEINQAGAIFKQLNTLVEGLFKRIEQKQTLELLEAEKVIALLVASIIKTPDTFLWLTQWKSSNNYTIQHTVNTCVLSLVLGRHIGLSVVRLKELGLCGLLFDMGKGLVPEKILNKPGKLAGKEIQIMKYHTVLGLKILKKSPGKIPLSVISVAYSHHERVDGKGYPRGIGWDKLTLATRIVAIADMYDALTSDRSYRQECSHENAIEIMQQKSGNHLDFALMTKFVECLGFYPPGTLVQLSNDDVAIVVDSHYEEPLRPNIILLLGADKQTKKQKLIVLADRDKDIGGEIYTIKQSVSEKACGLKRSEIKLADVSYYNSQNK
ncbi:HD-GYP domain-containing protein [sulfur-oxidizing endosymbiont of Gigantopelta aegis]|uniref:HD-GYP domain-containing protein n=1 Tax=sulfur-oxidizing endosymbiont of Gigantopelta aegis TaxID=2794934 RepID=UPI0018DC5123|nr:HD-GYP domain-containing protein [sulfur-oxidizing endosymbiont of Gigantopelta aegis]